MYMRPTTDNNDEKMTISREDYDFYTKYCLYETEENTGLTTTVNETGISKRKAVKKHNDTDGDGRDRINELLICSMGVSIVLSPVLFQCSDVIGEYASNLLGNVFLIILLLSIVFLPIRMSLTKDKEDEDNE